MTVVWQGNYKQAWTDIGRTVHAAYPDDPVSIIDDQVASSPLSPADTTKLPSLNTYGDGIHRSKGGFDSRTQLEGGLVTAGPITGLSDAVTLVIGCRTPADGTIFWGGACGYLVRVVAGQLRCELVGGAWFATCAAPTGWAVISALLSWPARRLWINGTLAAEDTEAIGSWIPDTPPAFARFGGSPSSYGCEWSSAVLLDGAVDADRIAAEALVTKETPL